MDTKNISKDTYFVVDFFNIIREEYKYSTKYFIIIKRKIIERFIFVTLFHLLLVDFLI